MTGTPLPAADYFSDSGRTNAEAKAAQDAILAFLRQSGLGNYAESTLTLATDIITPTTGVHSIETQGGAASDNCTNVAVDNMLDGQLLLLRAVNAAHVVTLKHNSGGSGQLSLKGAADAVLDATDKWVLFKLTGTTWEEIFRSWIVDNNRFCGTTGGTANAITVTPTQPLTSHTNARLTMNIATPNTAEAVTITPSGLTAKDVKQRRFGTLTDCGIGQLVGLVSMSYDGTQYVLENPLDAQSSAITAASTVDLTASTVTGNYAVLNGTTTITAITLPVGKEFTFYHNAITPITHGASLTCLTGASITTAVGDISIWRRDGTVTRMISYSRASGLSLTPTTAATQSEQEAASSTTVMVSPGRQHYHPSAAKCWVKFNSAGTILASYGIASVTKNSTGDFTITFSTAFSSAHYAVVPGLSPSFPSTTGSIVLDMLYLDTQTTTTLRMYTRNFAGSNIVGTTDCTYVTLTFYGDQ
jgi:hypothetical protein